jgi:hypothetical protein
MYATVRSAPTELSVRNRNFLFTLIKKCVFFVYVNATKRIIAILLLLFAVNCR